MPGDEQASAPAQFRTITILLLTNINDMEAQNTGQLQHFHHLLLRGACLQRCPNVCVHTVLPKPSAAAVDGYHDQLLHFTGQCLAVHWHRAKLGVCGEVVRVAGQDGLPLRRPFLAGVDEGLFELLLLDGQLRGLVVVDLHESESIHRSLRT